jgi:hypothetical protein
MKKILKRNFTRNIFGVTALIILSTALLSCASTIAPPVMVQPGTLRAGDTLPALIGPEILSLGGRLSESANAPTIAVDLSILEHVGTVRYSVNDHYEQQVVEYEGVLLAKLFDQFAHFDATSVTIQATDDYRQTISRADAEKWPILLALRADGNLVDPSHRGPSMIVYPYDQYSELEPADYDPFWVWQIELLTFS